MLDLGGAASRHLLRQDNPVRIQAIELGADGFQHQVVSLVEPGPGLAHPDIGIVAEIHGIGTGVPGVVKLAPAHLRPVFVSVIVDGGHGMGGPHPSTLGMDGDFPFLRMDESLFPRTVVTMHAEGSAREAQTLVDAFLNKPLAVRIGLVPAPGTDGLVEIDAHRHLVEDFQEQVREIVEDRFAGGLVSRGVDTGVILTPLANAPGAHPIHFIGIVELLGESPEEFLVALLEDRVVRVGRPDLGRSRRGLEALGALGADIIRAGVLMQVPAVGPELENEFETAGAGAVPQHPEAPGRLGIAGFVPEVETFFRLGLRPVRTDQQRVGIVAHFHLSHSRVHVVVFLPEIVRQPVSQAGIDDPATEGIAVHGLPVRDDADGGVSRLLWPGIPARSFRRLFTGRDHCRHQEYGGNGTGPKTDRLRIHRH